MFFKKLIAVFTLTVAVFSTLPAQAQSSIKYYDQGLEEIPQKQAPFTYYFPYSQISGDLVSSKGIDGVRLTNKVGNAFSFVKTEAVDVFDPKFIKTPNGNCKNFGGTRFPIDSSKFTSERELSYQLANNSSGENGRTKTDGCLGLKIKVNPDAKIGDETGIIFHYEAKTSKGKEVREVFSTLKISSSTTFSNSLSSISSSTNSTTNSRSNSYSSSSSASNSKDAPDPASPDEISEILNPVNFEGKTTYFGANYNFVYNTQTKKYDTVATKKLEKAQSVTENGCYYLSRIDFYPSGCGMFDRQYKEIEIYAVRYQFLFPNEKINLYRDFYKKQGFNLSTKSKGIVWEIEYYRFKDPSNGKFGDWKFYADYMDKNIQNKPRNKENMDSIMGEFLATNKAKWNVYEYEDEFLPALDLLSTPQL